MYCNMIKKLLTTSRRRFCENIFFTGRTKNTDPCRSDDSHVPRARRIRTEGAPTTAVVLILSMLLAGCSGTGTMFTPDSEEASSYGTFLNDVYMEEDPEGPDDSPAGEDEEGIDDAYAKRNTIRAKQAEDAKDEDAEEPRVKEAFLEGTGSDLYAAQTVEYYYSFTLDGVSLQLPCSISDILHAGWEIAPADTTKSIPGYSYEFVSALPVGSSDASSASAGQKNSGAGTIRLCLANFKETPRSAADCTVCGITAATDSGVSLKTAFGAGLGDTLQDLISVFGTDSSIYALTDSSDGVQSIQYHFANGLTEDSQIPVLAEAEEKGLAEMLLADTTADGETIHMLSLYYFRLP